MEGIQDEIGKRVPSSCSSRTCDLFKDPEISPRVGDEYQVELPPLMTKDELLQLMENPVHLGLPIPVMWVLDQCESINRGPANSDAAIHIPGLVDSEIREENHITVNNEDANGKVENLGPTLDEGEDIAGDSMEIELNESCLPVPGLSGEAWKDIERDSFLLGLYIFGKNFCLVKKFVGSKGMGEILSYYHGRFYKSSEYNKWLEFRKKRKKRRSYGEKIFTNWRQQELISRLSSHVSEECKTRLIEATRIFGEEKKSEEEYVLALKEMVGLKLLVQAIAIGKGKQDLIGSPMEHAKTNPSFPARPEIPSSKSGSSLTVDEIVNFLTGDIRLSKARSNDLFWDAVWPRLVDKGWRTEEPRSYVSLSSKQSWVYLIPGVKKSSKRKLIKGTHYFDSITDVLNKVALEPKLLELDEEQPAPGPGPQAEQGTGGFSYLQPLTSQEQIKFTIVDTSLVCGKEMEKVIELRTLPVDPAVSGGIEENIVKESGNVLQESDIINGMEDIIESKQFVDKPSSWIDLNLPSTPPDFDGNEPLLKKSPERSQQQELLNPSGVVMNGQRQSRRNRPLTTKVLEALACGYLSPKKKRKSREAMPKPPRMVRAKTGLLASCGVSIGEDEAALHKMEKGVDGVFNGSSHMVSTSQK